MSGVINLVQVKDRQAREALLQLNQTLCALESAVGISRTVTLTALTAPLDAGQQRITDLATPASGTDLLTFGQLTGLLGAAVSRFLKRFQGTITPGNP